MGSLWNVSAESLVSWVGVSDDGNRDLPETSRAFNLKSQLGIVQSKPLPAQMKIYSEVAAKYLPALMDLFRQTPEVISLVSTLVNVISTTPYFIRFLRSPAGEGIAALQAHRVANAVTEIPSMSVDDVGEIGQFLSSLLILQGIQDVSAEDKAILLQHLPSWERQFRGRLASETAGRCIALFTDDPGMRPMMDAVRNMLEGKLDKCGGPGCVRRVQRDGSVLSQCGRCKSAVYCGVAHQKAAWATHKATCFPAVF
ncbi:hypothetical protein DFH07DRAFT_332989 [Mycena maculata]|uniref:MYND-type domain-containing protein n=1 Tax=Mycena maculata TaxID=230809 RepID=A0AAD7MIM9_9AGAR|nr:hypothetical protein DFH07DRAFT_332989 [Mycena maculata]